MLAHTLLGALTVTALMVARSNDPSDARVEAIQIAHALIDGCHSPEA